MDFSCLREVADKSDKMIHFPVKFAKTVFPSSFGNPALKSREKRYHKYTYMNTLGKKLRNSYELNSNYSDIKLFTNSLTIKTDEPH